jgi:hypothetical protein
MSSGKWLLMPQTNSCIHLEGSGSTCAGGGAGGTTYRKVDKDNRMGYTGVKDVMEVFSVVGSEKVHNAYNYVFSLKGFFLFLDDVNKRFP